MLLGSCLWPCYVLIMEAKQAIKKESKYGVEGRSPLST